MPALRRLNSILERIALGAVIAMMLAMCLIVFAQVVGRYAIHYSLPWSEELSRFMLVWISMLGAAVAARRRMHVGFAALVSRLPGALRTGVQALALVAAQVTFAVMAWYGFKLASFNMMQTSAALELPMGIPYYAVPVGALLLVLFLAEELGLVLTGAGTEATAHGPSGFGAVE